MNVAGVVQEQLSKKGIFLVIVYTDKDLKRIKDIEEIKKETADFHKVDLEVVVVDARIDNKKSASKTNL